MNSYSDIIPFSQSVPSQPPHVTYAELISQFVFPLLFSAVWVTIGLLAVALFTPLIIQAISSIFVAFGLFVFYVIFRVFVRARDALDMMYEQWEQNQAAARDQLALDIRVSGKNNQVTVGNPTTNQMIVTADAAWFVKHLREFDQKANMLKGIGDGEGIERRHWLRSDGAVSDFQFSDGATITRPEYEQLVEALEVRGRRRGTSGVRKFEQLER